MYQVLYRKWRPKTFSDVYGQPSITAALKNELRSGRLAHAYLFTGSRGTGKTSCAKILAKAANCLHPVDGDPCNECAICRGIDSGAVTDVVEIDAASNNGVDNIRDLREEIAFTPVEATYRVYIIDEVHMLSTGAFNALLKTLEEPPAHALFILATTEVHKLPATILSRCQRFNFQRIPPQDIAARIEEIAKKESFRVTRDAALLLARLADGGLRDALSLLDQCVSRSSDISTEVVMEAVGVTGDESLLSLSACVREGDSAKALMLIDRLHAASTDMERLCAEWIAFYRNLMVAKSVADPSALIVRPEAELQRLKDEAARYTLSDILRCLTMLQQTLDRLRGGVSRRVEMEMAVVRLCSPSLQADIEGLSCRIAALEKALAAGRVPAPIPENAAGLSPAGATSPASSAKNRAAPASASIPVPASLQPPVPSASRSDARAVPEATPSEAVEGAYPSEGTTREPSLEAGPPAAAAPGLSDASSARSGNSPHNGSDPTAAPSSGNGREETGDVPFENWGMVLERLAVSSPPLFGVLAGSQAALRGDCVLICTDNQLFRSLVSQDNNRALLMGAIQAVTGKKMRVGLKKAVPAAAEKAPDGPLQAWLKSAGALGVDITVQEN